MTMKTALIGLGAIGTPIAHKLYTKYGDTFFLLADEERKERLKEKDIRINGDLFRPQIYSEADAVADCPDLLIVCVKNYSLESSLKDIFPFIGMNTVILPLQNGIYAYDYFKEKFPKNYILQGYIQGPNTEKIHDGFVYHNPGELHIGSSVHKEQAKIVADYLKEAGVSVFYEDDIKRMVWKKWMLNVAGNSVTALTDADYSLFKHYPDLQAVCRQAMNEFLQIAKAEKVGLTEKDIDDVIEYYISYIGSKKTSMLVDVLNEQKTENAYLAGTALAIGKKHGISLPIISTLYYLMEVKEEVYMERKDHRTKEHLFSKNVEYSDALKTQMNDIASKNESRAFANVINSGGMPDELLNLLQYASENSEFYKAFKGVTDITEFPVMNKTKLNANYDKVVVHSYDDRKTHKMHTSGSTGIPFTVIQDLAKRERHIADLKYFGALAGYADHDPMCYLRAKPTATPAEQERDNIWQLDICNLSAKNLTDYFHVMIEKKCKALIAYPSTLATAVDFWAEHFTNESFIKTIISTSETLTDEIRDKLRNFFGSDVGIYARYSNTEQGILGQESGESGRYCLNWASYYFEILKMDSDEPAEEGELGRIIVTDLYNKAFPMIRYDTGDVARMKRGVDGRLPELSELYGRRMDLIYDVNGEVVSPFLLCRTMRLSKGIEQWQFIQESETTYKLKITSNSAEKLSLEKELNEFQETLGKGAVINVEYVKDIPVMNSLKRKLIVSMLNK